MLCGIVLSYRTCYGSSYQAQEFWFKWIRFGWLNSYCAIALRTVLPVLTKLCPAKRGMNIVSTALESAGSMKDNFFFLFFLHIFFPSFFFSLFLFLQLRAQQEPVGKRNVYWYSRDYRCFHCKYCTRVLYLEEIGNFWLPNWGHKKRRGWFFPIS